MRPLILDAETKAAIATADKRARAKPIPWSVLQAIALTEPTEVVTLAHRKSKPERPPSEQVLIKVGFRAAISYEEQPAGLVKHLSISVDRPGALPNPIGVEAIARAFGIGPGAIGKAWIEEFAPSHCAVNIVELVEENTNSCTDKSKSH